MAKQDAHAIQQRFRNACQAFEQQERARQAQEREQAVQLWRRKVQLCAELDNAIAAVLAGTLTQEAAEARLTGAQDSWRTLAPLEDAIEKRIAARFQGTADTLHGLLGAKRAEYADSFNKQQQANLAAKELLCLRAEIAAEIDSPPEYRQQRMEFQVEQLALRMRTGDSGADTTHVDADALAREWEFIGTIPASVTDALQARFERAHKAKDAKGDRVKSNVLRG